MASRLLTLFSTFTHIACTAFVVVACLTIPEAWKLNESTYSKDTSGTIVYVPILICDKQSIAVEGQAIIFEGTHDSCHSLEYLINACVASLIFACAAMLIFFLFDVLARCNKGPVNRSAVLGMSFFMSFILLQAAACCYALNNECTYWEDYFTQRFAELGSSQVEEVKTYGDTFYFFLTCIMALACAGLLLIDTLIKFCCGDDTKRRKSETKKPKQPAPAVTVAASSDINTSTDEQSFANESSPEQPADPKKWTDY